MVVLPVFTGCTLLNRTEFYLLSQAVSDDNGFPSYALGFNTTGTITVKISGPQGLLYEKVFYKGIHDAILPLNDYRHTPWGGVYTLRVFDENDNIVFENQMTFSEPSLSVDSMELLWWDNGDSYEDHRG